MIILLLQDLSFDVQGLYEDEEYMFQIRAVNENGESEPLLAANSIIAKLPFGKSTLALKAEMPYYKEIFNCCYFFCHNVAKSD